MLRAQFFPLEKDLEAISILKSFVPDRVFDAHMHLYDGRFIPSDGKHAPIPFPMNYDSYVREMKEFLCCPALLRTNLIIHPVRILKDPERDNLKMSDLALSQQLEKHPEIVGEIIVRPTETAEQIEKRLSHPRIRGLKCYHLLAEREDTMNADIWEYLPESAWEVANKHGLPITLHMVKEKSLADPENRAYIKKMAKAFPNAKLILAHAARAFAAWTGVEYIPELAQYENLWYDLAAVCESPATVQILNKTDRKKVMWGSDYPVCRMPGKPISLADGFTWLNEKNLDAMQLPRWYVATENLMATRQACLLAELSASEVEDLFYNNAASLFD